jgi:hypothetical protein
MASIGQALFPRSTERASIPAYHPRAVLDAAFDVASMPGRAYASLGRPSAESYSDAMARTGPTGAMPGAMYQSEGDEFADMVLRDPFLPLGAMLSAAAPIRALGQYGRAGVEGAFNAGGSMADQYATTGRAELAPSLLAGVAGAAPGMLPAGRNTRAAMISPEERAANFRKWFGDSKVVDEAGNPLVVYHGTKSRGGFDAFDPEKIGTATDEGFLGRGFYFTTSEPTADAIGGITKGQKTQLSPAWAGSTYGEGGSSGAFHVSAKNPVVIKPEGWSWDKRHIVRDQLGLGRDASADDILEALQRNGNDAVILDYSGGGWPHQEVMIPSPTQIKSATGNRGTFDPNDPNITHLTAPKAPARAATPLQTLGSRLSAQAKHAALREYLSDDRPQGDTHYTSRSRR